MPHPPLLNSSSEVTKAEIAKFAKYLDHSNLEIRKIVEITTDIFDTEICNVGLIDGNFINIASRIGHAMTKIKSSESISAHVIQMGCPMVVSNLLLDNRFAGNIFVHGDMHLRFYAGMPIKLQNQHVAGMIAIGSRKAHGFDEGKLQILEKLAKRLELIVNDAFADFRNTRQEQPGTLAQIIPLAKAQQVRERRANDLMIGHLNTLKSIGLVAKSDFAPLVDRAVELSMLKSRCAGLVAFKLRSHNKNLCERASMAADRVIAELIHNNFRKTDILCRLGPGQYALLLPLLSGKSDLIQLKDRIEELLNNPNLLPDLPDVAACVRAAMYPIDGYDADELVQTCFARH